MYCIGFVSQEIEVYNTLPAADFCANVQSYKNNLVSQSMPLSN